MPVKPILDTDVLRVGRAVGERSSDGDVQISILIMTLISVAKSLGVPRKVILRALDDKWDDTPALFKRSEPGLVGQLQDGARRLVQ